MEGFVDFFEAFVSDVGVDLRRGDGCVTEHRLDTADVGAILEEVGGKAVTERVRVHVLDDAGFLGVVLNETLDTARGEA